MNQKCFNLSLLLLAIVGLCLSIKVLCNAQEDSFYLDEPYQGQPQLPTVALDESMLAQPTSDEALESISLALQASKPRGASNVNGIEQNGPESATGKQQQPVLQGSMNLSLGNADSNRLATAGSGESDGTSSRSDTNDPSINKVKFDEFRKAGETVDALVENVVPFIHGSGRRQQGPLEFAGSVMNSGRMAIEQSLSDNLNLAIPARLIDSSSQKESKHNKGAKEFEKTVARLAGQAHDSITKGVGKLAEGVIRPVSDSVKIVVDGVSQHISNHLDSELKLKPKQSATSCKKSGGSLSSRLSTLRNIFEIVDLLARVALDDDSLKDSRLNAQLTKVKSLLIDLKFKPIV